MKKRKYKKPFMVSEVFAPNFCTSPCDKDALQIIFDESSFYKKLFYDFNPQNDRYDSGEMVADYSEIPTTIIMNPNENEWPEGFYNVQNRDFINYANARNFYNKSPYTPSKKLVHVYAVKDITGKYYYFSSKPTTRPAPPHSQPALQLNKYTRLNFIKEWVCFSHYLFECRICYKVLRHEPV